MTCKNCNQTATENFCSNCGQSTKVDKINLPNFLSEVSASIFQVDRGFFYTLKELFVRPGHSIREYLSGKRKNHFKPVAYAFLLSTIYFLLSQLMNSETFLTDFIEGFSGGANTENLPEVEAKQLETFSWFAKNYAYTTLLLLPLYALSSYIVFLKSGFNYLEHLVLNAYITGQQAIFYAFFAILVFIIGCEDYLVLGAFLMSISYTYWVFWQFFPKQSRIAATLRLMVVYVVFLIVVIKAMFLSLFLFVQ